MHKDMHYAGTYALAKLAGLSDDIALKIGASAQFVDDSADDTAIMDEKTGELFASEVTTRYADPKKYIGQRAFLLNHIDQLAIWVPFHFLPGGKGDTLTQKLVCRPDSEIAQAMIASHLEKTMSLKKDGGEWGPYLIGVAAHVYADTFAHYGFSGVSSRRNLVDAASIREVRNDGADDDEKWQDKVGEFRKKWGYTLPNIKDIVSIVSGAIGEMATTTKDGAMGHPGVASMPDLPYLCYSFQYERGGLLYGGQPTEPRNNPKTYLQACEKMHQYFAQYRAASGESEDENTNRKFSDVREQIKDILSFRDDNKTKRLRHWRTKAKEYWGITIPEYPGELWKEQFNDSQSRDDVLASDAYKFFMAAAWHKRTVLDEILPKHGIDLSFRQYRIVGNSAPAHN